MKFLCVTCDEPLRLVTTELHQDIGSLSVVYECPRCFHKTAMLTNPGETQLIASLGVQIGPKREPAEEGSPSKCPFTAMIAQAQHQGTEPASMQEQELCWSVDAALRLEKIPAFVRPMVKAGIEKLARDRGYSEVTVAVLDEARQNFGL